MGTANYFSPEQAQGLNVDGRSDLYSLGVVMYEMLTGTLPFTGETSISIAYKHVQEQPEPISTKRPGVPQALQAITAKLLNKKPNSVILQQLSYKATFISFIWSIFVG